MRARAPPTHPNSLELFTLFSLPFLHFYNFVGLRVEQGRGRSRVLLLPRPMRLVVVGQGGHWFLLSLCQLLPELLGRPPRCLPSLPVLPEEEEGRISASFLQDGFALGYKLTVGTQCPLWFGLEGGDMEQQVSPVLL